MTDTTDTASEYQLYLGLALRPVTLNRACFIFTVPETKPQNELHIRFCSLSFHATKFAPAMSTTLTEQETDEHNFCTSHKHHFDERKHQRLAPFLALNTFCTKKQVVCWCIFLCYFGAIRWCSLLVQKGISQTISPITYGGIRWYFFGKYNS